jgi:predicted MFS family arabinose efflux permease
MPERNPPSLGLQLTAFSLIRTIINTGFRLVYPFLPTMARGVGVSLEQMANAVTARSLLGLLGPVIGSAGDTFGRRRAMLGGMLLFTASMVPVVLWPNYWTLFLAIILGAAGKIIFDPAMQAYLGDSIPYRRRAGAIAITELGWSGASLLGLPLAGWLIARSGWVSPFFLLIGLSAAALAVLWRMLPDDGDGSSNKVNLSSALRIISRHPSALAGLAISLLISASNEVVNIIYGAWMENSFGLAAAALGGTAAVIGIAELGGEGMVVAFSDRIGKRTTVGFGLIAILLTCLALPLLGTTLSGSLIGLFIFFISFEFTFVTTIPLLTELVPDARATLMAANITAAACGRALGALLGPRLFHTGIMANGFTGAGLAFLALVILFFYLKVD